MFSYEVVPAKGLRKIVRAMDISIADFAIKRDGDVVYTLTSWKYSAVSHITDMLNALVPAPVSPKSISIPVYEDADNFKCLKGRTGIYNLQLEKIGYTNEDKTCIEYDKSGKPININQEKQQVNIIGSLSQDMRLSIYNSKMFTENYDSEPRTISFGDYRDEE